MSTNISFIDEATKKFRKFYCLMCGKASPPAPLQKREKAISMFLQKVQPKQRLLETEEFRDALSYVKTLKAKGGKPIPADENNLDALVDKKYAL